MKIILFCCLIVFVLASFSESQIVEDGLVSYYTLDSADIAGEVVKDLIGDNNGKIVGSPQSVAGHLGEAMEFAGQPDCIELPPLFGIGKDPISYECWFIKPAKTDWSYLMVNKSDFHNNVFRLGFNQNSGQLRFYTEHENEANKAWITDEDYADGLWHHVVATRNGDQGRMYVDGKLVKEEIAMDGDIGGDQTNWYWRKTEILMDIWLEQWTKFVYINVI